MVPNQSNVPRTKFSLIKSIRYLMLPGVVESPAVAVPELFVLTRSILYVFLAAALDDAKEGPDVVITLLIPLVELITRVVVFDAVPVEDIGDIAAFFGDKRAPIFAPAVP